jgi:hypothetical protein
MSQALLSGWIASGAPHKRGKGNRVYFDLLALREWLEGQTDPRRRAFIDRLPAPMARAA